MGAALDTLAEIEQQVLQNGAPVPASMGVGNWQAVAFEQAGVPLLLDMSFVREVLPLPLCTRLPGVKSWVIGISNVRGQILPIIDLGSYLEQAPARSHPSHRVLVVRRQDLELGIAVDRIFGMKLPAEASASGGAGAGDLPGFMQTYTDGLCEVDGTPFGIFNLEKLLNSAAFKQIVVV